MRKKLTKFVAAALAACLLATGTAAAPAEKGTVLWEDPVQVGLAYGSSALVNANLENNTGCGEGYRLGYFDEDLAFHELGRTQADTTQITMIKTQNTWVSGTSYSLSDNGGKVIGCYHIQLPGTYDDFDQAKEAAEEYDGGFPAWISGSYQARVGAYATKEDAEAARSQLGLEDCTILGTTSYGVNVTITGTTTILFQFDGGAELALGVLPDVTGADEVRTWFKGYRYYGGFRYERISGGNITVVNIVDMETYIKGVIPYEMSNNWPLEALKAQAVCARSYAYNNIASQKHSKYHFDVCNTTDCQAYHGAGSEISTYQANERTDRAVDETAGEYAWYNGKIIEAYYSSSHGGASESVANVWGSSLTTYPYLCGVEDPYEQEVADRNSYSSWSTDYTAQELTARLQSYGYGVGTSVTSLSVTYSDLGNVIVLVAHYANGQSSTFKPTNIRSVFGVPSIRFAVNAPLGEGAEAEETPGINGSGPLDQQDSYSVISGTGTVTSVDAGDLYAVSGSGKVEAVSGSGSSSGGTTAGTTVEISADRYTLNGAGFGHQLGMSQYGAYAMVELGFSYEEIIAFYYPGVVVK